MATVNRNFIKHNLSRVLDYIHDEEKFKIHDNLESALKYITDEKKIAFKGAINCSRKSSIALKEMNKLKQEYNKTGKYLAHHYYQSFSPDDNITPEKAFTIAKEFAEKTFPNCQVLIATHVDKKHIHNHFVINSVMLDGKKLTADNSKLYEARKISDELCIKNNLSVIRNFDEKLNVKYEIIRNDIDQCILCSNNFDEFKKNMIQKGYKIKEGKYLTFTPIGYKRGTRNKENILGSDYTTEAIKEKINNKSNVILKADNKAIEIIKKVNIFSEKNGFNLKKEIISYDIRKTIKVSKNFSEFIGRMESLGYKINEKNGSLYFKHNNYAHPVRDKNLVEPTSIQEIEQTINANKLILKENETSNIVKDSFLEIMNQISYTSKEVKRKKLIEVVNKINFITENNLYGNGSLEKFVHDIENEEEQLRFNIRAYERLEYLSKIVSDFENKKNISRAIEYFNKNNIDYSNIPLLREKIIYRKKEIKSLINELNIKKEINGANRKIIKDIYYSGNSSRKKF